MNVWQQSPRPQRRRYLRIPAIFTIKRWLPAQLLLSSLMVFSGHGATPSRTVIEQHLDRSLEVYGHWAPVRLPIDKGVRIWNPTAIHVTPQRDIFVANYVGQVYRIIDTDGDGLEDTATLFCNVTDAHLRYPTTLLFKDNALYVGTAQQIRVYYDADGDGVAEGSRVFLELPTGEHTQYWTFGLRVGPDGSFYVNLSTDSYVSAPATDTSRWRGSLLRISPDGRKVETFATGLRFAPGMAFHSTGALFFSDNEGGGNPTEELNIATAGKFYGHNATKFSAAGSSAAPLINLDHGRGVCGIAFNPSTNDFGGTAEELFVAFWGVAQTPGDGSISRVKLRRDDTGAFRAREIPFCNSLAKPFDLAFGPSGDLYVTQFGPAPAEMTPSPVPTGAVYRFIAAPWFKPAAARPPVFARIRGDSERGRELFAQRQCGQCHATDGTSELLGPNLVRLGDRFDYRAARAALLNPSQSIRTGFESETVETGDGELIQGRIVTSDPTQLTLMVAGNHVRTIPRPSIRWHRASQLSLMPEGLAADLNEAGLRDLFAYLGIRERPFRVRWRYRLLALGALTAVLVFSSWCLKRALDPTRSPASR